MSNSTFIAVLHAQLIHLPREDAGLWLLLTLIMCIIKTNIYAIY